MPTLDGNHAAADAAYRLSEVIAIYPITPASPMGEHADAWAAHGRRNLWGAVPRVVEMQSEGGAAGALHGATQSGALATTFTASQGLLLMIPNLYKIAGELSPCVIHVASRTVATHALSIFGDHSDVYAARSTGVAMLASASVQEAHDLAAVAHAATLRSRLPFLHFFDGFRTSHEIAKIDLLSDDDLRALVSEEAIAAHRARALSPEHPVVRGTAHNPDTYFQAREAASPYYGAAVAHVEEAMDALAQRSGRRYGVVEYEGAPDAERVVVLMGSAAGAAREAVAHLNGKGEKVGLLLVRLFRPFPVERFVAALPESARAIAVLDRTKEPGAAGEPLYQDVVAALHEQGRLAGRTVVGGRYGLSSKEFNPAMAIAVFENLAERTPKPHFTVGIVDDVCHSSLDYDRDLCIEPPEVTRCVFYGLGSDGTVGANKNSIKIIGDETDLFAQGYFVYDSKKAGAVTVSHLRFGPRPIHSTYLISKANFVACHQWSFLDRIDVLERAEPGATFLLNAPYPAEKVFEHLPIEVQDSIREKKLRVFAIDAHRVAAEVGLGRRINTVMQTCFFKLAGVLPFEKAVAAIKREIEKTYGKAGEAVVRRNFAAVEQATLHLHEVPVPERQVGDRHRRPIVPPEAPDFVQRVTAVMLSGHGDDLPVSAFPPDGTWPPGTARWERRNIALKLPVWDKEVCIQCNKCALVCPHAAIRVKVYPKEALEDAPEGFEWQAFRGRGFDGAAYTVQVAPEDCTGCTLCSVVCPAKDKSNPRHKALDMEDALERREIEKPRWAFFESLPEVDRSAVPTPLSVKNSQFFEPLFEFSGACAGCGETPYIKLLTQLFGDRIVIANATGCSSIYGGNLPTTPYTVNRDGRGPAWSNSLFEDNAEFGYGIRVGVAHQTEQARALVEALRDEIGADLADALLSAEQSTEAGLAEQRRRVEQLRTRLAEIERPEARRLERLAEFLVERSVWLVGGDGWAYDIGYGGLDHVLASGENVNILVLDTEVYSNTGGQQSKATPLGAAAKFAVSGKGRPKKDLALLAMAYGDVYVAQIAFGASDRQTLTAFLEAAAYPGPSLLIAYSHCIAHGYDLSLGLEQQKRAADSGFWPLFRYDPRERRDGAFPLKLDNMGKGLDLSAFTENETRFRMVERRDPERARRLLERAKQEIVWRRAVYERLAGGGEVREGKEP
ncbi:MAG: pyruvate:ferredoxin (flavodoxin) oxidoreductase [Deltaproteobacteria bacterium]|nr:MAG: pyruvate:ferredoxin (flavodoxin) oxidoreductase [Deltaproteobacteria bacterium]